MSCNATQTQGCTGCWLYIARRISSTMHILTCKVDEKPNLISCNFRASQASPIAANRTKSSAAALCIAICIPLPLYGINTTSPIHTALRYIATPAICSSCVLSLLPVCKSKNIVTAIAHKKNGKVYACNARWLKVTQCGYRMYAVTIHTANMTILPRMRSLSVASLFCILLTYIYHSKSPRGIEHPNNRGGVQNKKLQ